MEYLETKYGTDKHFQRIGIRGGGIGIDSHVLEIASNELKEGESFDVQYTWNRDEKKVDIDYDTYIATRYKQQVDEFLAKKIKEIINKEIINCDVYVDSSFEYMSDNNYIKFDEYLISKDKYFSLNIRIYTDSGENIINKENIMNLLISEFQKLRYITNEDGSKWYINVGINGGRCVSIKVPGKEASYREY